MLYETFTLSFSNLVKLRQLDSAVPSWLILKGSDTTRRKTRRRKTTFEYFSRLV